jgi:hypothetical protein
MNRMTRRRIQKLERAINPPEVDDSRITVRFAHLHQLPNTYLGERHQRLVKGYPSEDPNTDCVIQECRGPGPELNVDFGRNNTILVQFVESDGDGHPKGCWPEKPQD